MNNPSHIRYLSFSIFAITTLNFIHCATYPPIIEKKITALEQLAMQDKIKEWIRADCGSCHNSNLPTANPRALQVFDLKLTDWMSRMNKKQLEKTFIQKLGNTVQEENRVFVTDALGGELYRRLRSKPL